MTDPFLARIERTNYAIAALLSLAALLTQSRPVVLGIVIGSTLTCINFFVLRKLVAKWTRDAASGKASGSAQMLMMPKMIGLMLAVTAAVLLLPLDVIAFAIGYSIFIVSIVGVALYNAITTDDSQPSESEHHNG